MKKELFKNKIEELLTRAVKLQEIETDKSKEYWSGQVNILKVLLSFIDSMEEEPVSNDLEEAADKHLLEKGYLLTTNNGEHLAEVEAKGLFKAGDKWQKEQMIDKACNYLFSHMGLFVTFFDDDIVENIERSEFIKKFRIAMEE